MKIVLIGIVRDESNNITEMLESVYPMIDFVSLTDTGSVDDTKEKIANFCVKKLIPYHISECEFKDYSQARNFNLQETISILGENRNDYYALFLDADDRMIIGNSFNKEELHLAPIWAIRSQRGPISYFNERLYSLKYEWEYKQPVHESLTGEHLKEIKPMSNDKLLVDCRHNGYRRNTKGIFDKDVELLRNYLKEKPGDKRGTFYLANSYRDGGRMEEALKTYKDRVDLAAKEPANENPDEVYVSFLNIARISLKNLVEQDKEKIPLEKVLMDVFFPLVKATEVIPVRPEAYLDLVRICKLIGFESLFLHYMKQATAAVSSISPDLFGYTELHSLDLLIEMLKLKSKFPTGLIQPTNDTSSRSSNYIIPQNNIL